MGAFGGKPLFGSAPVHSISCNFVALAAGGPFYISCALRSYLINRYHESTATTHAASGALLPAMNLKIEAHGMTDSAKSSKQHFQAYSTRGGKKLVVRGHS